jgi:23S rRNA (uracil1939-C5)-methyltransferase
MSICTYFPKCRGCDNWDQDYAVQKQNKIMQLQSLFNLSDQQTKGIEFATIQESGMRHRFDFTFKVETDENIQKMGFYDAEKKIIDIEQCLQLSPELQKVFSEFRQFQIATDKGLLTKGSVRLRVSPSGLKGCWLDLANVDIKDLLSDSTYLNRLLEAGFKVEVGQKGKALKKINGTLKLSEPQPEPWFKTGDFELWGLISDFTQPSWLSAQVLTDTVLVWLPKSTKSVIEFGPGLGQFTLALLALKIQVRAYEVHENAVKSLKQNAAAFGLSDNLQIYLGDFQKNPPEVSSNCDVTLVNPPRSGLKDFVQTLVATKSRFCIYISCFPESMANDLKKLQSEGYHLKEIKIVDQFPQTRHFETCVLLEKLF